MTRAWVVSAAIIIGIGTGAVFYMRSYHGNAVPEPASAGSAAENGGETRGKLEEFTSSRVAMLESYSRRAALVEDFIRIGQIRIPEQSKQILSISKRLKLETSDDVRAFEAVQNSINDLLTTLRASAKSKQEQDLLVKIAAEETQIRVRRDRYHQLAFALLEEIGAADDRSKALKAESVPVFQAEAALQKEVAAGKIRLQSPPMIQDPPAKK